MRYLLSVIILFLSSVTALSQHTISGTVSDLLTNESIESVFITVLGETGSTSSNTKGEFQITVERLPARLVFSSPNYTQELVDITSANSSVEVFMLLDTRNLSDVVLVGSRFQPRSITESPVPIDNITLDDLSTNGHYDLDMMLMYNIPSFNTSQQTVSDATAHVNPMGLRGLGPSRTLFLINGKRKGPSSLVYTNDTPGKGEVGVDLKGIPIVGIERVEVLRDGASAQYGSDAIAGVVNITLADEAMEPHGSAITGIHQEGDGEMFYGTMGFGVDLAKKGFINLGASVTYQDYTNRPGDYSGNDSILGLPNTTGAELQQFPHGGMIVGQPEMLFATIGYNAEYDITEDTEIYSFGSQGQRKGKSFALYRLPAWSTTFADTAGVQGPNGFLPDFQTITNDNMLTIGVRAVRNYWNLDLSTTISTNKMDYTIGNSVNNSLGKVSPTTFRAGGYEFIQQVHNFDAYRNFIGLSMAFGAEFRADNFVATAGEEASYLGDGVQSFPGIRPEDETDVKRYNISFYLELEKEFFNKLLLNTAGRFESYSDFGKKFTGKFSFRYKLLKDILNVRGSASTGFRAPSLQQTHFSSIQTILVNNEISQQGTFNNQSPIIQALNVPELKEETSENLSFGITYNPRNNFFITADLYNINVDDRIVFTGTLSNNDPNSTVGMILQDFGINGMKFFTNAIDTRTYGFDLVAGLESLKMGNGTIDISLAHNYNETEVTSELRTPDILQNEGSMLFDRKEKSRIETARPKNKTILKIVYLLNDWNFNLSNTRFGEVTWLHSTDPANDQTFSGKILTDFEIGRQLGKAFKLSIGANNLFDIYPDEIDVNNDPVTNLAGRFKYPWDVNQFGFNGRFYYMKMNLTL